MSDQKTLGFVLATGFPIGMAFGTALEKSKVFLPDVIRGQMSLEYFIMLKMFLSATATGMVAIGYMEEAGYIKRSSKANALGFGLMNGFGGNVVGGLILGAGIAICGSCPGTVLVQVAGGRMNAVYTLLGALTGAGTFGYVHSFLKKKNPSFLQTKDSSFVDKKFSTPLFVTSAVLSAAFAALVYGVEIYLPWKEEVLPFVSNLAPSDFNSTFSIFSKVWSPEFSGLVIGLLQVPSYLLMGTALGTSSSYVAIAAQASKAVDPNFKKIPYFQGFIHTNDFYQVAVVGGIMAGGFLSKYLSGVQYNYNSIGDFSPITYYLGGVAILFGARLAGGCTSGHGISGIARLANSSIITAACMFAGGIAFALTFF